MVILLITGEKYRCDLQSPITPCLLDPYTGQLKKKVTLSHVYNDVTSEPTITRLLLGKLSKFVCLIDAGKCFRQPPPEETVLQNGDNTAKGVLYPAVCEVELCNNCETER
jgi:hypothetical protein